MQFPNMHRCRQRCAGHLHRPAQAHYILRLMANTLLPSSLRALSFSCSQILPALYRFVGASFGATPSQLGMCTLSRAVVQALASPLGGLAGAQQTTPHVHPV